MNRRYFLKAVSAAVLICATLPAEEARAWVAAALAVAAAIAAYEAAKGNPTVSLINANFELLEGMVTSFQALNRAMQHLTLDVAALREAIEQSPAQAADLILHSNLFGAMESCLQTIASIKRNAELGVKVDFGANFDQLVQHYARFSEARNAYMFLANDSNFLGAIHICMACSFDYNCLGYMIKSGIEVDRKQYGSGHVEVVANKYLAYFESSINKDDPRGLIAFSKAAQKQLDNVRAAIKKPPIAEGAHLIGCKPEPPDTGKNNQPLSDPKLFRHVGVTGGFYPRWSRGIEVTVTHKKHLELDIFEATKIADGQKYVVEHPASIGPRPHTSSFVGLVLPKECGDKVYLNDDEAERIRKSFNEGMVLYGAAQAATVSVAKMIEAVNRSIALTRCMLNVIGGNASCVKENVG